MNRSRVERCNLDDECSLCSVCVCLGFSILRYPTTQNRWKQIVIDQILLFHTAVRDMIKRTHARSEAQPASSRPHRQSSSSEPAQTKNAYSTSIICNILCVRGVCVMHTGGWCCVEVSVRTRVHADCLCVVLGSVMVGWLVGCLLLLHLYAQHNNVSLLCIIDVLHAVFMRIRSKCVC